MDKAREAAAEATHCCSSAFMCRRILITSLRLKNRKRKPRRGCLDLGRRFDLSGVHFISDGLASPGGESLTKGQGEGTAPPSTN